MPEVRETDKAAWLDVEEVRIFELYSDDLDAQVGLLTFSIVCPVPNPLVSPEYV